MAVSLKKIDHILIISSQGIEVCSPRKGSVGFLPIDHASYVASLSSALSAAETTGKLDRLGNTLIFFENLFSHEINRPGLRLSSLSDKELLSLAFYEIEPYLDFNRDDGDFAFAKSSGGYTVAAMRKAEVNNVADLISSFGGKLIAIAPFNDSVPSPPSPPLSFISSLASSLSSFPLITVRGGSSFGTKIKNETVVFSLLLLLVLLFAIPSFLSLSATNKRLSEICDERGAVAAVNSRLSGEISSVRSEITTLAREREALIAALDRKVLFRDNWLTLFDALSQECGGRVVIKSLSSESDLSCLLSGVAPSVESASSVAGSLSATLNGTGWVLTPVSSSLMTYGVVDLKI